MGQFVLQINGYSSSAFPRRTDDPEVTLRGSLGRMNGDGLFSYLLWEMPDGRRPGDGRKRVEPKIFIQCAGSADALTVEVREDDGHGRYVLSTLGQGELGSSTGDVEIRWRDNAIRVHENECWASDDAADLFLHYWRTGGALPVGVTKRAAETFDA